MLIIFLNFLKCLKAFNIGQLVVVLLCLNVRSGLAAYFSLIVSNRAAQVSSILPASLMLPVHVQHPPVLPVNWEAKVGGLRSKIAGLLLVHYCSRLLGCRSHCHEKSRISKQAVSDQRALDNFVMSHAVTEVFHHEVATWHEPRIETQVDKMQRMGWRVVPARRLPYTTWISQPPIRGTLVLREPLHSRLAPS